MIFSLTLYKGETGFLFGIYQPAVVSEVITGLPAYHIKGCSGF